ncbi:predicted protein [Sclerotinia sclerotiorum 1980 UF-70]|uniref:Uncharacterized protein n=1 Tax=Sclerotinia sclerotiorum (strain ATCC 18683 / 1980 / Ss-1) TaxID=665079 RepID=A7EU03_SCLS1|nr:predicted protein [Sclerotinia sclerotiorum 1980 UF-70]EDN92945.1 predicted protein [Sclerotinia sclerotiorum 1980 UF-70]
MFTFQPRSEVVVNGRLANCIKCIPIPRMKREIKILAVWPSDFCFRTIICPI